jgi:RHS repeat-associated protein
MSAAASVSKSHSAVTLALAYIGLILSFYLCSAQPAQAGYWVYRCAGVDINVQGEVDGIELARKAQRCLFPLSTPPAVCTLHPNGGGAVCNSYDNNLSCVASNVWTYSACLGSAVHLCYNYEVRDKAGNCVVPDSLRASQCTVTDKTNPIELNSGTKTQTFTDWTSGGEYPLELRRNYSSSYQLILTPAYTRLGSGWRTNFDSLAFYKLSANSVSPAGAVDGDQIHIVLPDAIEYSFRRVSGIWKPVIGRVLTTNIMTWDRYRTDTGLSLTVQSDVVTMTTEDGTSYSYDFAGRLIKVQFIGGYVQLLEYAGELNTRVSDSFGRSIDFEYGIEGEFSGYLKSARTSDGKIFKYQYGLRYTYVPGQNFQINGLSRYNLGAVIYPDGTPATDADNPRETYSYLANNMFPFALTSVTDELGVQYASWTYDEKGRATSSQHAGGADSFTVAYDDANNKTTVTNPLGRQTTYSFSRVQGQINRLVAVDGIATSNCAASNTAYAYNANGFRSLATDAEGRITSWTRNSKGQPITTIDGFGTPQARTVLTSWHPSLPLPTQVAAPGVNTTFAYNVLGQATSVTATDTTTTTLPYATAGQSRTTAFTYASLTQPLPPPVGPTGPVLPEINLPLVNTDGNGGTTTGWTSVKGALATFSAAPCAVSACFYGGANALTIAQQDIAVPTLYTGEVDMSKRAARVTWLQNSALYTDRGTMRLVFLDINSAVVGTGIEEIRAELAWTQRMVRAAIPAGTRIIRVQIIMERTAGTPNDAYFDDIALALVGDGSAADNPSLRIADGPDVLAAGPAWSGNFTDAALSSYIATSEAAPCDKVKCFRSYAGTLSQTSIVTADRIAEIDGDSRAVQLKWLDYAAKSTATTSVVVTFLDATDHVLGISDSPQLSQAVRWLGRSLIANVPAGTRKIKIEGKFRQNSQFGSGYSYMAGFSAELVARQAPLASASLLASVDGPMAGPADTVTYQYFANGDLAQVTDEVGLVTKVLSRDGVGRPLVVQDANAVDTNLSYDQRGRLTSIAVAPGPMQSVTSITYDAIGQITGITAPDGSVLIYQWSDARQIMSIANGTGEKTEYSYNANGDVIATATKNSSGQATRQMTMVHDALGRLLRSIGASGQTHGFAYDRTGMNTSVTDPRNNMYSHAYDSLQRLVASTDHENATTSLSHNAQGDVVAHADPRNITTTYVHNGFGEVIQETSPDADVTVLLRDARGLVTQKTDGRGAVSTMSYDAAGRLLTETYPAAPEENVSYQYDSVAGANKGKGRLTSFADQSGSTSFVYDVHGNIVEDRRQIGERVYVTSYAYTSAGKVAKITYPSGRIVEASYNSNGLVQAVESRKSAAAPAIVLASQISYAPMSNLVNSLNHFNGLVTVAGHDLDYRLSQLRLMDGAGMVAGANYAYGDGLNLTAITDMTTAANSNALAYSPANRLVSASGTWGDSSYGYDGVGNRLYAVTTGAAARNHQASYDSLSNRLLSITENAAAYRSYAYDGGGNVVTDTRPGVVLAYGYNKRNRLASVTRNGQPYGAYVYNALEQLVSRTSDAPAAPLGTVHYIHDLDGHVIAEADAATGAIIRDYVWLPANDNQNPVDLPLAIVSDVGTAAPRLLAVHTDHLGRPTRLTDSVRSTVWSASWTPWGEPHSLSGGETLNLRFPGQYFQIETGLAYNWHRHYDATTGRYTQPDPLRFIDGPSLYAYAGNSPFMFVDEDGQVLVNAVGTGTGAIVGAAYVYWKSGGCASWSDIGVGALNGALIGSGFGALAEIGLAGGVALATRQLAQVTVNRNAGNAFRDELAIALRAAGRDVKLEVVKRTPFGRRIIDIEVKMNGRTLGGIETKLGGSRYTHSQQAKDTWLRVVDKYIVNVARKP